MSVYTVPALNAVDFGLRLTTPESIVNHPMALTPYSAPALSAVDFELSAYTLPTFSGIDFELLNPEVPDVVGETEADGTTALEADGFVVVVETAYSSVVPVGLIISQEPAAWSDAAPGSTVTITVSLGEEPVTDEVVAEVTGGGYLLRFDDYSYIRKQERKRRLQAEAEAEELQEETDRQIASFLHRQEALDAERADLERLKLLAEEAQNFRAMFPELVQAAIDRAIALQTTAALLAFERALRQQIEQEDIAVLLLLLND